MSAKIKLLLSIIFMLLVMLSAYTQHAGCCKTGSVVAADGILYILEEKTGKTGLAEPSGEKPDIIGKPQVTIENGPFRVNPVINNGRLHVRHGEYLATYSIKAK